MDIPEQALRIRNQIGIPRPSCPTTFISGLSISYVPVPIHIQNHYIGRNLIILDFRHNPAVVICRISRVFAIPISEYIIGRQWYLTRNFSVVGNSFLIIITITQIIDVKSIRIGAFRPPVKLHIRIGPESIRTPTVRAYGSP